MILFKSDWAKYPNAIVDINTTNTSFLRMGSLLREAGVEHYYFHLALFQPELSGVDVHSKTLTTEQKVMVRVECEWNPFYYLREVVLIPNGQYPSEFRLNRGNLSVFWSFLVNLDYAFVAPRQTGKSIIGDVIHDYLLRFKARNTTNFLLTKDPKLRKSNIKRIKKIQELTPKWLNPVLKKDADNSEFLDCTTRDNILLTAIGQAQIERADNIGRGETLTFIHVDEAPHMPNIRTSLPVLLAAGGAAKENAENAGVPYGTLYTTTAGRRSNDSGEYMYLLIHSGMPWSDLLYDRNDRDDCHNCVEVNQSNNDSLTILVNGTFSHRQLGYTDEWLTRKVRASNGDPDTINRDYYNRWDIGTENSPLPIDLNKSIYSSMVSPAHETINSCNCIIKWYVPEDDLGEYMAEGQFVAGLDTANGVGRDGNDLVIMDMKDMSVVGTSTINRVNLNDYGLFVGMLLIKYVKITLVCENKMSGMAIMDTISSKLMSVGINPFTRMFSYIVSDRDMYPALYDSVNVPCRSITTNTYNRAKGKLGFQTGARSRKELYGIVFREAAKSTGHLVKDSNLITQLMALVRIGDKIDHPADGNDDSVIAWLIAHWFVRYSKNLSFYGINNNRVLIQVSKDGATLDDEQLRNRELVNILSDEVLALKESLIKSTSQVETSTYAKMLKIKVKEIEDLGSTSFNMDSFMSEIEASKSKRNDVKLSLKRLRMMNL